MKFFIVKGLQTVPYDTSKFKTYEEWLDLLRALGENMYELSGKIERAKVDKMKRGKLMPKNEWDNLNTMRYQALRDWKTLADHMILLWPEKISFTSNKFMRLVRERHQEVFEEIWPEAAADPTTPIVSKEGRPNV